MLKFGKKQLGTFLMLLAILLFLGWLLFIPATNVSYNISQRGLKEKWIKSPPVTLSSDSSNKKLKPKKGDPVARLKIKKLSLDTIVLEGASTENLKKGPAHLENTSLPGEPGNCVISGHRVTYGAPFRHLDRLKPGDPIEIIALDKKLYTYKVYRVYSTLPSDASVLATSTFPEITLTTCDPPHSARRRLIVKARLFKE